MSRTRWGRNRLLVRHGQLADALGQVEPQPHLDVVVETGHLGHVDGDLGGAFGKSSAEGFAFDDWGRGLRLSSLDVGCVQMTLGSEGSQVFNSEFQDVGLFKLCSIRIRRLFHAFKHQSLQLAETVINPGSSPPLEQRLDDASVLRRLRVDRLWCHSNDCRSA